MWRIVFMSVVLATTAYAETAAFLGSPRSATLSDIGCEALLDEQQGDRLQAVCMSRVFILKYEVVEALVDARKGGRREFFGFYHYRGLPDYVVYDPAFIILKRIKSRWVLDRIDPARRRDGKWWICEEYKDDGDCLTGRFLKEILDEVVPTAQ